MFVQDVFCVDNKAVQYKLCDYKLSIIIVFVCTTITICETKKMSDALLTLNVAADSSKKSGQGVSLSKITSLKSHQFSSSKVSIKVITSSKVKYWSIQIFFLIIYGVSLPQKTKKKTF
jgi:hypothetical protein